MQFWHMKVIVYYIFLEVDDILSSMCQILISFFEMDNLVYHSFALKDLFIVDTLFFDLFDSFSLCGQ